MQSFGQQLCKQRMIVRAQVPNLLSRSLSSQTQPLWCQGDLDRGAIP